ncbi:hypothetical protein ALP12_100828 [Pseudomonas savastanoi pv. phaseolicola]|nr:hypothetical protein ALP12_100828 [Pseudomonas savastanoi pv. phaseolicola]
MLCPMMSVCRCINVFMTSWPSRSQPITGTLARDYAGTPLEWRRSHAHFHVDLLTELPDSSDMAAGCEVFAFPEMGVAREGTHTLSGFLRAPSSVTSRTGFSNAECSLSASPTEIFS